MSYERGIVDASMRKAMTEEVGQRNGTDIFDRQKRSEIMALVHSKNTKPEKKVRSILHRLGYRYRLHRADLPGKPDIVLPKYRTVVFVHGCFWHQHPGCRKARLPKQNYEFWSEKLSKNAARDLETIRLLEGRGWRVVVVWECEIKSDELIRKLLSIRQQP